MVTDQEANEIRASFLKGTEIQTLSKQYGEIQSVILGILKGRLQYRYKTNRDRYLIEKCREKLNPERKVGSKRIRQIWSGIKYRCDKKDLINYGGSGIKICDEWRSFDVFYNWAINNGYQDDLEIDRINNRGNYEPKNCRWVTRSENAQNTSGTKLNPEKVRFIRKNHGIKYNMLELAVKFGVSTTAIYDVVNRKSWKNIE